MSSAAPETGIQFENDSMQMAFSVMGSRSLGITVDRPAEKVCDFLSSLIARRPEDLLVHVQRIKLARKHALEVYLRGALLDLFIVLGKRGGELRRLMLEQAKGVLRDEYIDHLAERLNDGIDPYEVIENPGVSMLSRGISGRTDFIDEAAFANTHQLNPLEQALASIEISQLEEARAVLEDSVLAGISDRAQQALLLDLYRKTGDHVHFSALYANLRDDQNYAPEAWRALETHFDDAA